MIDLASLRLMLCAACSTTHGLSVLCTTQDLDKAPVCHCKQCTVITHLWEVFVTCIKIFRLDEIVSCKKLLICYRSNTNSNHTPAWCAQKLFRIFYCKVSMILWWYCDDTVIFSCLMKVITVSSQYHRNVAIKDSEQFWAGMSEYRAGVSQPLLVWPSSRTQVTIATISVFHLGITQIN